MNKTVFIMDGSGNAVQWAAGMSLDVGEVRAMVAAPSAGHIISIATKDPRACVSHFVRALCACPDGSLLEWDEEKGVVGCKTWAAVPETVDTKPVEEATPVAESDGAPEGWRELGDDEIISDGDLMHSMGMFCDSYPAQSSIGIPVGRWYGLACSKYAPPTGKVWRKVESDAPVDTPEPTPALLPDGRPIIPVPGHKKWRELYDDEVIQEGDRLSASESLDLSAAAGGSSWNGKHLRSYRLAGDEDKIPYGKGYRRINPKKQKAGEERP